MNDSILDTFCEIEPVTSDAFLKIKETLTRIGIVSRKNLSETENPTLWQSCHILHKQGRYYIVHFKQLFLLDGKNQKTDFTEEDQNRTFLIASLLEKWGLTKNLKKLSYDDQTKVVIIPFKEKDRWNLQTKYNLGANVKKGAKNYD